MTSSPLTMILYPSNLTSLRSIPIFFVISFSPNQTLVFTLPVGSLTISSLVPAILAMMSRNSDAAAFTIGLASFGMTISAIAMPSFMIGAAERGTEKQKISNKMATSVGECFISVSFNQGRSFSSLPSVGPIAFIQRV